MRIMQLIKSIFVAVVSIIAVVLAGCEPQVDPNNPPTMELDIYELSVTGDGGDIPIFYSVTNPVKGALPEATSNVEWISIIDINSYQIMLRIAESDSSEERMGFVTINYRGMEKSQRVYITQDKQPLNDFKFSVSDVTYKSCKVQYSPRDPKRPYMANIIDSEYFKQTGITDGEQFVANEMNSYLALAQRNNMTLEELMGRVSPQLIYKGDSEREFMGMQPGATYTIYSYGIEFSGNSYTMTTPLHTTIVDIPMQTMYDVSFNITTSFSNGTAMISVTPENWDGYYAVQVIPDDNILYTPQGEKLNDYTIKSIATNFYTTARNAIKGGYNVEQYLRSTCYKGSKSINMQLSSDKKYMVIVFAVESKDGEIPVMRSLPTVKYL